MGQGESKKRGAPPPRPARPKVAVQIPKGLRTLRWDLPWAYSCNLCMEPNLPVRYVCSECRRFDMCESCYEAKGHEHLTYRETLHPQEIFDLLRKEPTVGRVLLKMFELYGPRRAFGERQAAKDSTEPRELEVGEAPESRIIVNLRAPNTTPLRPYKWITFAEVGQRVHDIGNGLRQFVEPRSFVALCSHVQLPLYLADYACLVNSIIGPVLGPTLPDDAYIHVINSTKMVLVFCASALTPRFLSIAQSCPSLKYIIQLEDLDDYQIRPKVKAAADGLRKSAARNALVSSRPTSSTASTDDPEAGESKLNGNEMLTHQLPALLTKEDVEEFKRVLASSSGPIVLCLADLERLGRYVEEPPAVVTGENELETLVYTSGSTGVPKGAMFSASAWKTQLCHEYATPQIDVSISWSISDRKNDFRHLYYGGAVAIYNGDMARIFEDIAEVRPNQMNATPAFWNKIYVEFKAELAEALDEEEMDPAVRKRIREELLDKYQKLLGGRVEKVITGGAPTSQEVLAFMSECFKCTVKESYGATECGGIVSAGLFASSLNWKLQSWEEYTVDDKPYPRGELCVRKEGMMSGYYGDPATTSESLDADGYYHTGDIVELNAAGNGATIIDRKKNIFKLSQGEFVAPAKIESLLIGHSPYVKQVFVYGDSFKSSLVAVVVPHKNVLIEHFTSTPSSDSVTPSTSSTPLNPGNPDPSSSNSTTSVEPMSEVQPGDAPQICPDAPLSYSDILKSEKAINLMLAEFARIGKDYKLRTFEIPAAIVFSAEEFTRENGLYTQSEKPARHALLKHFKTEIELLYETLDAKHSETKSAVYALLNQSLPGMSPAPSSATSSVSTDANTNGEGSIGANTNQLTFVQMGGDSLSAIKLRNTIKREFNVSLPVDVLLNPNTDLNKIASYIDESKRNAPGNPISADQFAAPSVDLRTLMKDSRLDAEWKPAGTQAEPAAAAKGPIWSLSKYSHIMLTGATGFLGTALLAELLKSTSAKIYCLVRPREKSTRKHSTAASSSSQDSGPVASSSNSASPLLAVLEKRISDSGLLGEKPLKLMKKSFAQRVVILEGSLEQHHFGLAEDVWDHLLKSIQVIFNAGAYVNSVLPYHRLAPSNVEGTRTCIELCSSGCPKLLLHVSTSGVIGGGTVRREAALQSELWSISDTLNQIGGYNLSKYVAELLVWEAIERGYSAIIVRPGFIGSASTTGFSNDNDFDNRLLIGLTQLGVAPDSVSPLITFPVDSLCRALAELSQSPECNGQVYHMVNNGSEMSLQVIVDALRESGWRELKQVPFEEWKRLVHEMTDEQNPIFAMVDEYFSRSYFHQRRPQMLNEKAMAFVKSKMKGKIPATDLEYAKRWILWLKTHGYLKSELPSSQTPDSTLNEATKLKVADAGGAKSSKKKK